MLAKLGDVSLDAHKASGGTACWLYLANYVYYYPNWPTVAGDSAVLLDALRYYEESLRVLMPLGYSELAPIVYNFACALALGGRAPLCEQQLRWLAVHSPSELGDAATDSDFDRVKGEEWFLHLMRARR